MNASSPSRRAGISLHVTGYAAWRIAPVGVLLASLPACSGSDDDGAFERAYTGIDASAIAAHTERLASDEFEGRAPATRGEELTLDYLVSEFEQMGLEPAGDEGFLQRVPMVEIEPDQDMTLQVGDRALQFGSDFVAWTRQLVESTTLEDSELVFAGYGIVAPEYGWNDYEGVDWTGKTAVVLVNDPGYATEDPALFTGRAMTYYGRWTYKYEEAARQGAAGLIIIHEDGPAGYGWNVVENSWSVPQYDLRERDDVPLLDVEAWITRDVAETLIGRTGTDLEALKARALRDDFSPVPLGELASIEFENTIDELDSFNVVATRRGDVRPEEEILYVAHWDHLGMDRNLEGDNIYNGAADNASGTAALLETARAFASYEGPLERSVSFLAVTAEEKGLLGSLHYASDPALEPGNIVAARQGREVIAHPDPESGYFYRSDHLNLVRLGIPSLALLSTDPDYVSERYHQPSDEFDPEWSFEGAVADTQIFFEVGFELAGSDTWPAWSPESEFQR